MDKQNQRWHHSIDSLNEKRKDAKKDEDDYVEVE